MKTWLMCLLILASCSRKKENDNNAPNNPTTPTSQPDLPKPDGPKYTVIEGENGLKYHTGLIHQKEEKKEGKLFMKLADCENLPDEFDLRKLGTVPDIRDQGQCGSCWSFSKTASLESALMSVGKPAVDLSEQELVSCDKDQYGCQGGFLDDFKYQIASGESLETDFPYTASDSRCKTGLKPAAKGISFAYVGSAQNGPTEAELKCALYKSHTVPWITVRASNSWSSPPKSEDKMYSHCGSGQTNHAVGVVGWKLINGKVGFIMKNSWGKDWGDKGYMTMPLGCDSFGDEAAYIVTEGTPCKPPMVKLPSMIQIQVGTEVLLGVKDEAAQGWTYEWDVSDKKVSDGPQFYVTPEKDTVYTLKAKNKCGEATSSVKVVLI